MKSETVFPSLSELGMNGFREFQALNHQKIVVDSFLFLIGKGRAKVGRLVGWMPLRNSKKLGWKGFWCSGGDGVTAAPSQENCGTKRKSLFLKTLFLVVRYLDLSAINSSLPPLPPPISPFRFLAPCIENKLGSFSSVYCTCVLERYFFLNMWIWRPVKPTKGRLPLCLTYE